MGFLSNAIDKITGGAEAGKASMKGATIAADAALEGSKVTQGYQEDALKYLQDNQGLQQEVRQGAISSLAGLYGLPGGTGDQQQFIDQARLSPLYGAIMSTRQSGEDAILRNASATGGLRSGNASYNLNQYNQELEAQALLESYNQKVRGTEGLMGLADPTLSIAGQMNNIGETAGGGISEAGSLKGLGVTAQGQAIQAGRGSLIDAGATIAGGMKWSDRRLKTNVRLVGRGNGINRYSWDWNEEARALGLEGSDSGVMADEILHTHPDVVSSRRGYLTVNYAMLGV